MASLPVSKGVLLVVSGFSGAGKGTVVKELQSAHDGYALSVSVTTRAPREGEIEGVHYFFRTKEEFRRMIDEDAFLEHAEYVDNYYGTPRAYVEQKLSEGTDVILEIEMQGALQVKERFPEAVLIFITPPSAEELRRRLTERGTETQEVIDNRLRQAARESGVMADYDNIIINDTGKVAECAESIHQLVCSVRTSASHNIGLIREIQRDMRELAANLS